MNKLTMYKDGAYCIASKLSHDKTSDEFKDLLVQRLGEYENMGSIEEINKFKMFFQLIEPLINFAENINHIERLNGNKDLLIVQWKLYNLMVKLSKNEIDIDEIRRLFYVHV